MSEQARSPRFPEAFPGVRYYDDQEADAVLRVIRARAPFRYYGVNFQAEARSLEKQFAASLGLRYAQATSSGSSALATAVAAFGIGPGQEVLVPGFFWVATVAAVVRAGGVPVLVEIDDSFTMDPDDLTRRITDHSRLIIPVHMCGVPSNMPAIMEIAAARGVAVLEDYAQANGATLHGKPVGTFGDMGMFSFQINKNITAGEGGMVVTDDETLYARATAGHDLGIRWSAAMSMESSDRARWEASEHVLWGGGARMNELTAAVVRAQLPKLATIVATMRASKHRIRTALGDLPKLHWRRVNDPDGDSGPFIIATLDDPAAAVRFTEVCGKHGLACTRLADYGLHVYGNVQALVEKRSNSPDGFPWTHPANVPLVRDYAHGALPKTDELLAHSVMLCVPSRMTAEQEDDYIAVCREAHAAAYAK